MFTSEKEFADKLTYNTKRVIKDLQDSIQALKDENFSEMAEEPVRPADIFFSLSAEFYTIFKNRLAEGISQNREYGRYTPFHHKILSAVGDNLLEILKPFVLDGGDMSLSYREMATHAGDLSDFFYGVNVARAALRDRSSKSDKRRIKASLGQRAAYWKRFVWPVADTYQETISLRMAAWGDKAPYWYFLENGNVNSDYAFPTFKNTSFFRLTLLSCRTLFVKALSERTVATETTDEDFGLILESIAEDVIAEFLSNIDHYTPGTILHRFYNKIKNKHYEFYVTKRRRLGLRQVR
jgi:hypothetical protein